MNLISKKELLAFTGISYGQLYRWKRENLIPEEWFIKKSSFTGQETFFPREQILSRVETILHAKENYSLEELAKIFAPEKGETGFAIQALHEIAEISADICNLTEKSMGYAKVTLAETALLCAITETVQAEKMNAVDLGLLLTKCLPLVKDLDRSESIFIVFYAGQGYYGMFQYGSRVPVFDKSIRIVSSHSIENLISMLKLKYKYLLG